MASCHPAVHRPSLSLSRRHAGAREGARPASPGRRWLLCPERRLGSAARLHIGLFCRMLLALVTALSCLVGAGPSGAPAPSAADARSPPPTPPLAQQPLPSCSWRVGGWEGCWCQRARRSKGLQLHCRGQPPPPPQARAPWPCRNATGRGPRTRTGGMSGAEVITHVVELRRPRRRVVREGKRTSRRGCQFGARPSLRNPPSMASSSPPRSSRRTPCSRSAC